MMLEKQCKSGMDKIKASSSAFENPSAAPSDPIRDSPEKGDPETSKTDHGKSENDAKTTPREGSDKINGHQEEAEKHEPDSCEAGSQPTKRPRTTE